MNGGRNEWMAKLINDCISFRLRQLIFTVAARKKENETRNHRENVYFGWVPFVQVLPPPVYDVRMFAQLDTAPEASLNQEYLSRVDQLRVAILSRLRASAIAHVCEGFPGLFLLAFYFQLLPMDYGIGFASSN